MDPCSGLKVISFNHFLAGPAAAQLMGDLGADVIAVEPLTGAFQRNWAVANHFVGGQSVNHINTGRNKRSLAVDLKSPAGQAVVRRLVAGADVVMENFRPGAMARLGLDPDALMADHPRLIFASATGFGADGPFARRPGQDLLLQAMTGLAAHTGSTESGPVPVGSVIIDHHTAALCVMGILAALYRRERTGVGGRIDVSLLQSAVDLQGESVTAWINGAPRDGALTPGATAAWFSPGGYGVFATTDGHIAVAMATPATLGAALGDPALAAIDEDAGFARRDEITATVAAALATRSTADAIAALDAAGVWNAPVEDYDDLERNPQLAHLGTFREATSVTGAPIKMVGHPVHYDGAAPAVRIVPQPLGAQTREVLAEIGYGGDEIDGLIADGTVAVPADGSNG